jgi:hypothetical protein
MHRLLSRTFYFVGMVQFLQACAECISQNLTTRHDMIHEWRINMVGAYTYGCFSRFVGDE